MQSYCIYAEAFAGPFWPLRAPEPPFTHKTPPFTQVLFLFDAFYGTISLRKPSSLCSYKTESEVSMKKRILALLLAFSMMLSLLPVSALADTGGGIGSAVYASNGSLPDLVMGNNGMPDVSQIEPDSEGVYQGAGWKYEIIDNNHSTLTLETGIYDFNNTKPTTKNGDVLKLVNCKVVVESGATITGGRFHQMLNYGTVENSLLSNNDIENRGGTMTNCLFKRLTPPEDVTNCHKLTEVNNSKFEVTLPNAPSVFMGWTTYYFTGTPKLVVKLATPGSFNELHHINGEENYGGKTGPDAYGYYTFTPEQEEDIVLNQEPYATDLVMTPRGFPETTGREPIYDTDGKTIIGCKGNGWKYENGTLTLESGSYDFSTTKPTTKDGDVLKLVNCKVVVENGATITGGHFRAMSNYGTVENSLLSNNTIENCDGGTMTNCLFCRTTPPVGVANYHKLTEVNNNVFDVTLPNASDIFSGWTTYYFTGTPTLVVCLAVHGGFNKLNYINGDEHYGNLTGPDSYGYYTFTPIAGDDIVLNREPYATDLVITEGGIPDSTNREPVYEDGKVVGYKGTGWKYKNDTLTLESGSYRFIHEDGDSTSFTTDNIFCNVIVQNGVSVTGGYFSRSLVNYGTIERAAIYHDLENHNTIRNSYISSNADQIINSGSMGDCLFTHRPSVFKTYSLSEVENYPISATLNGVSASTVQSEFYFTGTPTLEVQLAKDGDFKKVTYINGKKNYGGLKGDDPYLGYAFTVEKEEDILLNDTIIHEPFTMTNGYPTASNGGKTACKGEGWEYILGNPEHGDFLFLSNAQIDFSKISDGSPVECKLFIGHGVAVQGGTFNGDVINNGGGILGGTFNGAVENHGTIKNGVFNGAVENHGTIENGVFNGAVTNIAPGTVSNSITGTGTLNGKPITPNAYTLTVTGGGLVNDKTSAVVEAGDEVCLTVGEMQDGMSFNYWDLPTALTKALTDSSSGGFSNKVESLTFTMPDLSEYTEDKSFTIRLDIRPAELPDDDDGPSVLGTMATVAVGGAAAGILVWQGVSLGVDSYLQLSLPGGVPVPTNRRELVKLLWETAGKPDVVLPALYGDVSAEDGELQKATRWAIDNGLVKSADETDASRFDPDRSVSKYEVARAWFKVQQMLK